MRDHNGDLIPAPPSKCGDCGHFRMYHRNARRCHEYDCWCHRFQPMRRIVIPPAPEPEEAA